MILILLSTYIQCLVALVSIAFMLRIAVKSYQLRWVCAGAAALLSLYIWIILRAELTPDYHIFWRAGRDIWEGLDPYDPARFTKSAFLNPPTAIPLFALFAVVPYRASLIIWTLLNSLFCLALPALARRALYSQEGSFACQSGNNPAAWAPPRSVMVGLTAALIVSDAFAYGLFVGQLGLLTALALLAALDAQGRGRRILAGFWLALATIKVSTMSPFLLLFHRRTDLRTWAALVVFCSALCLLAGPPAALPQRLSLTLERIEGLSSPGQVNDYSFQGTQNTSMLGFEHAFYRLGLRNRSAIRILQLTAILALGLWVMGQVVGNRLPRAALCSLVALYSVVFFYHGIYDTVILTLPLVYCVGRARIEQGRSRWCFAASAISILLVLNPNTTGLKSLSEASLSWGVCGRLVQATLLTYAT
jgi:hypothetical protein